MTKAVRRGLPGSAIQAAHLYLANWLGEADAKTGKGTKERGPYSVIAAHCRAYGEKDDKGSYTWQLAEPIVIDGRKYTGFKLQASHPSPYFDEEKAQALIDSMGPDVVAAATRTEIVYDYDYLFLLLQQGKITSEDLDAVLVTPDVQHSLTVLKGQ